MFEELLEAVVGPWGIAAALLVATKTGRKLIRGASKEVVKIGIVAGEKAKGAYSEMKEQAAGLVAEAQAERTNSKPKVSSSKSKSHS